MKAGSGRQWNDAAADQAGLTAGGEAKEEEGGGAGGTGISVLHHRGGRWKELTEGTLFPD